MPTTSASVTRSTRSTRSVATTAPAERRPGRARRGLVAVVGGVACVLPVVWTVNFARMLATGELAEHRFHQLTGQGLLLTATWLLALVPLVAAGVRGHRPPTAPGLLHLAFGGVGVACAVAAPQGGAPVLLGIIAVTGALVWLALPLRPRLRAAVAVAPAGLAGALVLSAAVAPYAVDQLTLQHAATGHHAENPHYFDMAWLLLTFAAAGVLGALLPAARALLLLAGVGAALTGAAALALGEGGLSGPLLTTAGLLVVAGWTADRVTGATRAAGRAA